MAPAQRTHLGAAKIVRILGARPGLLAIVLLLAVITLGCGGGAATFVPPPPPPMVLTIATQTPLPRTLTGQPYSLKLQASGGATPYTWSILLGSGILPPGLALASDGTISGTATQAGDYAPLVQVQDATGNSASKNLELLSVAPLSFQTTGAGIQDGNVGITYFAGFSAQGGVQPYSWSLASGSAPLPQGLTLDSKTGAIQGTPSTPGIYPFTVQVADSGNPQLSAAQAYSIKVLNNLILTSSSMPGGVIHVAYSQPLKAVGGTQPYHWSLVGQSVPPPGMTFDSAAGAIGGVPTATGLFAFAVQVTDSASPQPGSVQSVVGLTVYAAPAFVPTTLADTARGQSYAAMVFVDGGVPPLGANVVSGVMPDGLSIASANAGTAFFISGNPTKSGLFQFSLKASDAYSPPNTVTQGFQIRVSDPLVVSTANSQERLIEGQTYSATFTASGGFPPYTWSASSLPPGAASTISPDATQLTISGTGTIPGFFNSAVLAVQDSSSPQLSTRASFELTVYGKMRVLTSLWPPIVRGNRAVLTPFFTGGGGGNGPISISIAGSPPPGMTFDSSNGTIYGIPTQSGVYPLTITESDGGGALAQTASMQWMLTVKDPGQVSRNDTLASATPISNSAVVGSISPFADPATPSPDQDIYQIAAVPGSLVVLSVISDVHYELPVFPGSSPIVPVAEVLDASGKRLHVCGQSENGPFNSPCVSGLDGQFGGSVGLQFQVPGSGTTPATFYIRVLDARGDARPDLIYTLSVFEGVN